MKVFPLEEGVNHAISVWREGYRYDGEHDVLQHMLGPLSPGDQVVHAEWMARVSGPPCSD